MYLLATAKLMSNHPHYLPSPWSQLRTALQVTRGKSAKKISRDIVVIKKNPFYVPVENSEGGKRARRLCHETTFV